jgi:hypothetical protein
MAFSQGSRAALAFIKETTFGTTPATPALQTLNTASHDLNANIEYIPNPVMRSDRQKSAPNPGNQSAVGQVAGPLHWNAYDALLEGLFCSTWASNVLTNGLTRSTYTFERAQLDNSIYGIGKGMFVNTGSITFASGQNVDVTLDMIGKSFEWTSASVDADGYTAPVSANVLCKPGLGTVKEGGVTIALVTNCTLNFANNAEPNYVYGNNYMPDFSLGEFAVTGTLTLYWPDKSIIEKFTKNTQSALEITASDGVHTYTFTLPKVTYTGGSAPVNAQGSLTIDMPFEATLDPVTGYTARITRV